MKLASVAKTGGKKGPLAPLEVKESISLQNIINSLFCRKLWPESPIAMYRLNRLSLESIAHLCWEAKALQGVALFLPYLLRAAPTKCCRGEKVPAERTNRGSLS
jgi:hypothetical protein